MKMLNLIAERITRWYLTRQNIAWLGHCSCPRSPDVKIAYNKPCPNCDLRCQCGDYFDGVSELEIHEMLTGHN